MIRPDLSKLSCTLKMTMLSLLVTGLLTGCGIKGSLKTPPPIFGGNAKVDPERVPTEDLDKDNDDGESEYGLSDETIQVDP